MAKIGLFFGTQTGNTETIAEMIQKEFGGEGVIDLHDVSEASADEDNQGDLTKSRVKTWTTQLKSEFGV